MKKQLLQLLFIAGVFNGYGQSQTIQVCSGGTLNLTASAGTRYSWTGPNNFTSAQQNPGIANATTAMSGTYTVTIYAGSGSTTATTSVTINPIPSISANGPTAFCSSNPVQLTASSGTAYSWSNGATTQSITASSSGNYSITENSCTSPVTVVSVITPAVNPVTNQTLCNGVSTSAINFTGTAGSLFTWTNDNPSIGLAAGGSGNIASFRAVNTGTTPVTATITVTPSIPYGLAYITSLNTSTVSVINTATNTVAATIGVGSRPFGVSAKADGSKVYVSNENDGTISVINTADNSIDATIFVGYNTTGLVVSPDGSTVYVCHNDVNAVAFINTATNSVINDIPVGNNPIGIAISPDGSTVYVANNNDNTVSVIDAAAANISATVAVGNNPFGVAVSPDGSAVYVTNNNGGNAGSVSVIRTTDNTVTNIITVGNGPGGIAINPSGSRVYVSDYNGGKLSVINTATNAVIATLVIGDYPVGISVSADGSRLYVNYSYSNYVSVINAVSNVLIKSVPVGERPYSLGNFLVSGMNCSGAAVTFTITVNPIPSITASGSTAICAGSPITLTASAASNYLWSTRATTQTITVAAAGSYYVKENGCTSQNVNTTLTSIPLQPVLFITTAGSAAVCPGDQYSYSIRKISNAAGYTWIAPASSSIVSGGGSNDTTVTLLYNTLIAGTNVLSVTANNFCGSSIPRSLTILANVPPKPVITAPSGSTKLCPGNVYTYTIRKLNLVNDLVHYDWIAPASGSILGGGGTSDTTITIQYNTTIPVKDSLLVRAGNNCSNSAYTVLYITPNTVAKPGVVTAQAGGTAVCPGNQFTYSIAAVSGASAGYSWTAPRDGHIVGASNTTTVTVHYDNQIIGSDTISVSAMNGCGAGLAAILIIKPNIVVPVAPLAIIGQAAGVQSSTQIYSIVPVTGMTYNWLWTAVPVTASSGIIGVPSGTGNDSVGVSFTNAFCTGTLGVKATNACGLTSIARSMGISGLPGAVTGGINGAASICLSGEPDTTTYSVNPVPAATSYLWTLPTGARALGSATGNSIVVIFPATFSGGNIIVRPKNACGYGTLTASLTVSENTGCRTLEASAIEENITVYPNPTNGLTTVAFNSPASAAYSLKVLDITGRMMMSQEGKTEEGINLIELDMNGYAKGIYIISFSSADQRKEVRIVVE